MNDTEKLAIAVKAIQDFIDGNYVNPSDFKPNECPHGTPYYKDCQQCDVEHFQNILSGLNDERT